MRIKSNRTNVLGELAKENRKTYAWEWRNRCYLVGHLRHNTKTHTKKNTVSPKLKNAELQTTNGNSIDDTRKPLEYVTFLIWKCAVKRFSVRCDDQINACFIYKSYQKEKK